MHGIMVGVEDSALPGGRQQTCSRQHTHSFLRKEIHSDLPVVCAAFDNREDFELILSFCPGRREEIIQAPLRGTTCPFVQNHTATQILEDEWELGSFSELQKVGLGVWQEV